MKDHKDDLYSAGYLGLYKAIKTFKPDKGIQFMTYATRIIENEMLMIFRKYKKMKTDMSIHESMGSDAEGHDLTLEQILPDLRSEEELETIMRSELASKILEHLEFRLSVTSRNGSKAFTIYSIYLEGESTHREIGDLFGLSQSYISRIITKCDKMVKEIAYKLMEGKSL
jgi:RNA polymerase sporulation-specific sigma factor